MISYIEALNLIKQNTQILASEEINTLNSFERVISDDIYSPIDLPSFDNSAMDGFALKSEKTITASIDNPLQFLVHEVIAADKQQQKTALHDGCSQIMTGAAIPVGYDAVIPIELVTEATINNKKYITINQHVKKFANIRFSGEDVKSGNLVLKSGTSITATEIMLLSALGIAKIKVFKTIPIAIASTGNEISDNYDKALTFGEIYNSNSPLLINLASSKAYNARYHGILEDDSQSLLDFIDTSNEQVLITTGAVSKGIWDFIPDTLRSIGANIIFHNVAIRPGKPILFAKLKDGRYFLGLPGNPVSSIIGWRFFGIPLFYAMLAKESEKFIRLKLKNEYKKHNKLKQFLKAKLTIKDGVAYATIDENQESFKIKPLTTSDMWVILDEQTSHLKPDELVEAVSLIDNL